jgi:hypothetical protein
MRTPIKELIETDTYSLLTSEVEPGLGIEVFRVSNNYHTLSKQKKVEMLETLMSWGMEELAKTKLTIDSTSNADMNIGMTSFNTNEK